MVLLLKVLLTVLVAACVLVLVTYGFIVARSRGVKASGVQILLAITVYSPFYWLLVAVILAILWWLCRRWLF